MSETYTVRAECTNCDWTGGLALPKGTPATGEHKCPECGCKTARKKSKPVVLPTYPFPVQPWIPPKYEKPPSPPWGWEIICGGDLGTDRKQWLSEVSRTNASLVKSTQ